MELHFFVVYKWKYFHVLTYTGSVFFCLYIAFFLYLSMVQNPQRGSFRASPPFPKKGEKSLIFNNPITTKWFDSITEQAKNREGKKKIPILEHPA